MNKKEENTTWADHIEEWTKLSNSYKEQALVKDISDPLFYRHTCIQDLISKTATHYK